MAARDKSYSTPNYRHTDGTVWHIGGTLELGDVVTVTTDAAHNVIFTGVPVADPHVVGALWANVGVLTLSAG